MLFRAIRSRNAIIGDFDPGKFSRLDKFHRLWSVTPMTAAQLHSALAALAPAIADRSSAIEQDRRLPADLAAAMAKAGFFNMLRPQTLGGYQLTPREMMAVLAALAQEDASVGWCAMIGATSTLGAAYMEPDAAREVFGDPGQIHGGVFAPMGKAEDCGDHYLLNGQWQWGSGSANCDWLAGGAMIVREGELLRTDNGAPIHRMLFFPADRAELIDSWHVHGLKGTGSGDFAVRDLKVPKAHSVGFTSDEPRDAAPLYKFPLFGLLSLGVASVALGNGRAALAEAKAMLAGKRTTGGARTQAQRATVQAEMARAHAAMVAAEAYLEKSVDTAWDAALGDGPIPVAARAELRLACAHVAEIAADVCKTVYTLGGGGAVFLSNSLQRRFRDAHVVTQHLVVAPATFELAGRALLGEPVDTATL